MAKVKIFGDSKEVQVEGKMSGEVILKQLGVCSSSTVILRSGKPIPEDSIVGEDDDITIIKSFSGG